MEKYNIKYNQFGGNIKNKIKCCNGINTNREKLWFTKNKSIPPSQNLKNVLDHAFPLNDFNGECNAYTLLKKYNGHGMDWWCFPWDLDSSRNQYKITWNDMKYMLENIMVSPDRK